MKPNNESDSGCAISRRTALAISAAVAATLLLSPITATAQSKLSHSTQEQGAETMTFTTTKDGTQIFYKDWGPKSAQPIVFHHGWPLSSDDWDAQMLFFLALADVLQLSAALYRYPDGMVHGGGGAATLDGLRRPENR